MNSMIFKHGTPFHDLVIHRLNMVELLVTHILKATTKGSKSGLAPKVHKSIILHKEFNKEKVSYEKPGLGFMSFRSFREIKSS